MLIIATTVFTHRVPTESSARTESRVGWWRGVREDCGDGDGVACQHGDGQGDLDGAVACQRWS